MAKEIIQDSSKLMSSFASFPTVLVTCQENIITVTLIHIVSFLPPLLGIGIKPERYSYGLIKEAKEFVVNIPTKDLLKPTIFCGAKSGKVLDKFKEAGLTKQDSLSVKTKSVKECPVNIECKVVQELVTGDRTWFVGEIVNGRIADDYKIEDSIQYWRGVYRLPGNILK
ncbi:MAG: flavin reductase family protein [Candidatus Latescibacteria bacterium]|nr:flavin reductase family protein [Candidatus Latescibacterota bacterium]